MVASAHPLGTLAGVRALKAGGSAVDAAIAANAAVAVASPDMCGPGGDLFALVYEAGPRRVVGVDSAGAAGTGVDPAKLRVRHHRMPDRGPLSVTVPGAVAGWGLLHERFGRLPWASLFEDAADAAETGFAATERLVGSITSARSLLVQGAGAATYLPGGVVPAPGEVLVNPDLGRTLRSLMAEGPDLFYTGELGAAIARFSDERGGPLRAGDLAAHRARLADPVSRRYGGFTVLETAPPSQGFTALVMLGLMEHLLPSHALPWTVDTVDAQVRAKRLAFAVRERILRDPDRGHVPVDLWLRDEGLDWILTRGEEAVQGGDLIGDTTYLCAVDADGNACSLVQSLYRGFGSGEMVPGTGFFLQNRGSYFSLSPEHPNAYAPGVRTAHTLSAAMVLDDDQRLRWVLGTMGGDGQPQFHAQILHRLIDAGEGVAEAIAAPRWIDGDGPSGVQLHLEAVGGPELADGLGRRGYAVELVAPGSPELGHAQGIAVGASLSGGADPRGDGLALGW